MLEFKIVSQKRNNCFSIDKYNPDLKANVLKQFERFKNQNES